jgi:hypothetical protein
MCHTTKNWRPQKLPYSEGRYEALEELCMFIFSESHYEALEELCTRKFKSANSKFGG